MSKTFLEAKKNQDTVFEELAILMDSLASPVRLKIIHFLSQGPHSVEHLSIKIGQSLANTSMHLKKMQRENILQSKTSAQKRIYSLTHESMKDFWEQIQNFAQTLNDNKSLLSSDIYPKDLTWHKPMSELVKLIKSGKCTLLDVRPDDEIIHEDEIYEKYVTHLNFEDLKGDHLNLPKSKPILVFCRGRLCLLSCESTVTLRNKGFKAYKLDISWHQLSNKLKETV